MPARFDAGPNASAAPGGFILVDTRMLTAFENDDQLAYLLAHEAAHIVGRHFLRQLLRNRPDLIGRKLELPAEEERDVTPLGQLRDWWEFIKALVTGEFVYSRQLELEADQRALVIMERAGYTAKAAVQWMTVQSYMADEPELLEMYERVLGTHPPLSDRAAHLATYWKEVLKKGPFGVYLREGELWIGRWDGTALKKTGLTGNIGPDDITWGPAGDMLAVHHYDGEIFTVCRTDLKVTEVAAAQSGNGPAWGPGGDRLAYASEGDIWLFTMAGRSKERLTAYGDCSGPVVWSPDGSLIAFGRVVQTGDVTAFDKGLWGVQAAGGTPFRLTEGIGDGQSHWRTWPILFSPDGTWIVYHQDNRCYYVTSIRSDDGESPTLTANEFNCWLPGGRRMVGWSTMQVSRGDMAWEWNLNSWDNPKPFLPGFCIYQIVPDPASQRLAVSACRAPTGDERWEPGVDRPFDGRVFVLRYPDLSVSKTLRLRPSSRSILDVVGWHPDAEGILVTSHSRTSLGSAGSLGPGYWFLPIGKGDPERLLNCATVKLAEPCGRM